MDDVDRSLVTVLRHDRRRGTSDLATELGLSRATVRHRISRMGRVGDIVGCTVVLGADAVAMPVRGLTMIEVEGRRTAQVVDDLAGFQEVGDVHTTNGRWDLVAGISADGLTDLDAVLRRLRPVSGVTGSETSLPLATPRGTRARL